jgi:hypothetical protein
MEEYTIGDLVSVRPYRGSFEPVSWWRWYLDAGDAIRQVRFRGNRCRELLDASILIGTEKAGILTQLEQWFSPYHIPIYPLGGNREPCFPT